MRKIIFRGKRIDNGEWIEGSLVIDTGFYESGKIEKVYHITNYEYRTDELGFAHCQVLYNEKVDPSTIGEYTGFKDKHGKMIFEGDILDHYDKHVDPRFLKEHPVVCFGKCHHGIYGWFFAGSGNIGDLRFDDKIYSYEIIGNIHDNPDIRRSSWYIDQSAPCYRFWSDCD